MPYIISPYREVEMGQKARVSGHVKIKKVDREGRTTFESGFDNLILDYFLQNGIYGVSGFDGSVFMALAVGTGAQTTPQGSDTTLNNLLDMTSIEVDIAGQNGGASQVLGPSLLDDYRSVTTTATFDYPEAVGDLTELGLVFNRFGTARTNPMSHYQSNASDYSFITRALIKDNAGNPVVLTKTSAEKLIIEYEIRTYRTPEPTATFNLNGQDIKFFMPSIARDTVSDGRDLLDLSLPANLTHRAATNSRSYNDLVVSSIYIGAAGYSRRTNHIWGLCKNTSVEYPAASLIGNAGDLATNLFTGAWRIDPDTSDRVINTIGYTNYSHDFVRMYPGNDPFKASVIRRETYYNNCLATLDPVTNQAKDFTLPAGYRLDVEISYERTR